MRRAVNMYPLTKHVLFRCFHCSKIRHNLSKLATHCANVRALGKPNVNVQNMRQIHKSDSVQGLYSQVYRGSSTLTNNTIDNDSTTCSCTEDHRQSKRHVGLGLVCCESNSSFGFHGVIPSHIHRRSISTSPSDSDTFQHQRQSHFVRKYHGSKKFVPQKMLILPKVTRFSYEKGRFPDLSENELRCKLAERGSDYEHLFERHNVHMTSLQKLVEKLEESGASVTVCTDMKDFTEEAVDWADLVISAGGDGTFLSASRKVFGDKPIIGINTDFAGSEGFLCLPRKYSGNITRALKLMESGSYRWRKRARIRVTVKGGDTNHPIDLYDEELTFSDHRHRHNSEREKCLERRLNGDETDGHIIPIRALNEVYVGESLSSRMSYYEISVDGGPLEKQKSSGITMCTGTGSTSWSFNINKLSNQSVEEVLKLANRLTGSNYPTNQESVKTVADSFNGRLLFDPRVLQMVYTVRDPVVYGIFQVHKPRGFARKITIRSRCRDACLTVDAGTSYLFNDGATATLEMFDEDSIKTIEMLE